MIAQPLRNRPPTSLLDSLYVELVARIRRSEGEFAPLMIGDLDDALRRCETERERIRLCQQWRKFIR